MYKVIKKKIHKYKNKIHKKNRDLKQKTFFGSNSGVSPIIAVLLILAITVLMAGYLGVTVLSYEFEEPPPALVMRSQIKNHNGYDIICIEHRGGESIEFDRLKFSSSEGDIRKSSSLNGEIFEIGKTVAVYRTENYLYVSNYPLSSNTRVSELNPKKNEMSVLVIDEKTNNILFEMKN